MIQLSGMQQLRQIVHQITQQLITLVLMEVKLEEVDQLLTQYDNIQHENNTFFLYADFNFTVKYLDIVSIISLWWENLMENS